MAEYIERTALRDALYVADAITMQGVKILNQFPAAADVAPVVHGRWEVKCESHRCNYTGEYDEDYYLECSVCHRKVWDVSQDALIMGDVEKAIKEFPFCYCGARMDLGKEFIDSQEKVESGQLVEVVRCKDCKHYNLVSPSSLQDYPYCSVQYECDGTHKEKAKNDFCSYGERRGE